MGALSCGEIQKLDRFQIVSEQIAFLDGYGMAKIGKGKAEPFSVFILKGYLTSGL
jgi:hypothetical protein